MVWMAWSVWSLLKMKIYDNVKIYLPTYDKIEQDREPDHAKWDERFLPAWTRMSPLGNFPSFVWSEWVSEMKTILTFSILSLTSSLLCSTELLDVTKDFDMFLFWMSLTNWCLMNLRLVLPVIWARNIIILISLFFSYQQVLFDNVCCVLYSYNLIACFAWWN